MKKIIKNNLVRLPRKFRILFGKIFIHMLGTIGTHEFDDDIILYNELSKWIGSNGKPITSVDKNICIDCDTKLEWHEQVGFWCKICKRYE